MARLTRLMLETEELAICSWPLPSLSTLPLTAAEREIVAALVAGKTLAVIARQRRRARATVRHQVEAIYGKLGVHSRAELTALLADGPSSGE